MRRASAEHLQPLVLADVIDGLPGLLLYLEDLDLLHQGEGLGAVSIALFDFLAAKDEDKLLVERATTEVLPRLAE